MPPLLHHHHHLLLPSPLFVDSQLTHVIVVMADGGHGGAEYPCCFCVDGVVVASSSRLPLSCFGGVEHSPFPLRQPPDIGKQTTLSICVILTAPSSRHCHCQRHLHCTTTEVLPLPSPRVHRLCRCCRRQKLRPQSDGGNTPPPFAAMIYHSLYLKANCCIVVGVASWIDVVIIITSPPSQTSCSE